jgi:hypothetical protein
MLRRLLTLGGIRILVVANDPDNGQMPASLL